MNGLLFLVAVFLAWPTMGLSLLAYFGWLGLLAYLRADAREQAYQREAALRLLAAGEGHPPSWANNAGHIEAFIGATIAEAARKGIPRSFMRSMTNEQKAAFINYLGLLEDQGASNRQQGVAAGKFIDALWAQAQRATRARLTAETEHDAEAALNLAAHVPPAVHVASEPRSN